ncbi:MAG: hypothetical protein RR625_07455, partial [Christensenellaceae bacterium]
FQIITMVLFEIFFLCIPIALELLLLVLFIIKKNCSKGHIVKAIAMILCVVLSGLYLLFLCAMLLFIVVDKKSDALFIIIDNILANVQTNCFAEGDEDRQGRDEKMFGCEYGGLRVDRTEMKTISEKLPFIKEACRF